MTQDEQNKGGEENLGSFYMGRGRRAPEPERTLPKGLLTGVAVAAFAGIVWYAYPQGAEKFDAGQVPVVKADAESYKATPSDPGGMNVPHQDSTVFDSVETAAGAAPQGEEKLIARQDEPVILPLPSEDKPGEPIVPSPEGEEGVDLLKAAPDVVSPQAPAVEAPSPVAAQETPPKEDAPKKKPEAEKQEKKAEKNLEKKAEAPAAPAATSAQTGARLQLGAFRSEADAKGAWTKFSAKYAVLSGLSYKVERVEQAGRGVFFRLQAIVSGGATAAKDLCATIKSAGGSCLVMK